MSMFEISTGELKQSIANEDEKTEDLSGLLLGREVSSKQKKEKVTKGVLQSKKQEVPFQNQLDQFVHKMVKPVFEILENLSESEEDKEDNTEAFARVFQESLQKGMASAFNQMASSEESVLIKTFERIPGIKKMQIPKMAEASTEIARLVRDNPEAVSSPKAFDTFIKQTPSSYPSLAGFSKRYEASFWMNIRKKLKKQHWNAFSEKKRHGVRKDAFSVVLSPEEESTLESLRIRYQYEQLFNTQEHLTELQSSLRSQKSCQSSKEIQRQMRLISRTKQLVQGIEREFVDVCGDIFRILDSEERSTESSTGSVDSLEEIQKESKKPSPKKSSNKKRANTQKTVVVARPHFQESPLVKGEESLTMSSEVRVEGSSEKLPIFQEIDLAGFTLVESPRRHVESLESRYQKICDQWLSDRVKRWNGISSLKDIQSFGAQYLDKEEAGLKYCKIIHTLYPLIIFIPGIMDEHFQFGEKSHYCFRNTRGNCWTVAGELVLNTKKPKPIFGFVNMAQDQNDRFYHFCFKEFRSGETAQEVLEKIFESQESEEFMAGEIEASAQSSFFPFPRMTKDQNHSRGRIGFDCGKNSRFYVHLYRPSHR